MQNKKKRKKSPFHATLSFVMLFVMAISAVLILYVAIFGKDKAVFGYKMYTVVTSSMGKTIRKDELIITKKIPKESIREGEIITFISSDPQIKGEVNTHRIHRILNDVYYTKGDGNNYVDKATVSYEDIIGKVTWHSIIVGKIVKFLQKPARLIFFVILPMAFFAFIDFRDVLKRIEQFKEKKKKPKRLCKLKRVNEVFQLKMRRL